MKGIKPDGHPPAPGLPRDLCRDHVCGPSLSIQYHHPRGSSLQTNQFTIPASTCLWITNVLADRRQQVELGKIVGDPKGYILSPLPFSLYTSDCRSRDPTVKLSGHRPHQRGPAYRCGVEGPLVWLEQPGAEPSQDFWRSLLTTLLNNTMAAVKTFRFLGPLFPRTQSGPLTRTASSKKLSTG